MIGIAAGTVILPEMSRRLAAGDVVGASHAQNRAVEFTLLLSIPCVAAFVAVPELIMRALFVRAAFTVADATGCWAHAHRLCVPACCLFVLIRSTVATFFARGDTATPVKAALIAAAVNIGFKFLLMGPLAQVGLALATSIGAWINLGLIIWFGIRAGHIQIDERLLQSALRLASGRVGTAPGPMVGRRARRAIDHGLAWNRRYCGFDAFGRHRLLGLRRHVACFVRSPLVCDI